MEELLKIAYANFINEKDATNSESVRIINENWESVLKGLDMIKDVLSERRYEEIYDLIYNGSADVQEAAFIAGFSYCAKFLTNGKVEFLS